MPEDWSPQFPLTELKMLRNALNMPWIAKSPGAPLTDCQRSICFIAWLVGFMGRCRKNLDPLER
jgi:hypothetical protein